EVRMAEKPVDEGTPTKPVDNEKVKTGDESQRNHIGWYGLGAAGLLASILLLGMKKKKEDANNEK
ncbi:MAG TPA: LPXTG cell wall anchor domain-containing protein, partial [Candidatus Pelethenecus sp.]|nr:LPXTG cell wall anchor domain-containing protein [Candidatus Pelethenecus sp.]